MKKVMMSIAMVALLLISGFFIAREAWKGFGFRYCIDPSLIIVQTIEENEGTYHLTGTTMDSASSFVGYTTKIEGDNLYIGLKYNFLLGFFDRNGDFDITVEGEGIDHIYLVNEQSQRLLKSE